MAVRTAEADWKGNLGRGCGAVSMEAGVVAGSRYSESRA